ncbi:MAG: hypothetical protein EBX52_09625 [Proteobacteria bacterium]|nr:hypothetical protein [Pseudomonadota bacterium]
MEKPTLEKLTLENHAKGFLMDEELMGGISEDKNQPGTYSAFIVRHTTGETLGFQQFTNLFEAIRTLNAVERAWEFTPVSRCGSGNCGTGKCGKGGRCGPKKADDCASECHVSE